MYSKTPAYNLKAVLKETGLKPDVLRAWERRYGLPSPGRTEGGHRLYSDHDVALLKWLMQRQAEGLSISRAANLWQEAATTGKDLLQSNGQQQGAELPAFTPAKGDAPLAELRVSRCDGRLEVRLRRVPHVPLHAEPDAGRVGHPVEPQRFPCRLL